MGGVMTDGGNLEFWNDIRESELAKALSEYRITIKEQDGKYRKFTDVIFEIKDKWNSLSENEQNYLCSLLTM